MSVVRSSPMQPITEDVDDYRPNSRWRLVADTSDNEPVTDISLIIEHIAPGDEIPLHIHQDVNECIHVVEGRNELTLGTEKIELGPGDVAFIPRGTPHAQRNAGDTALVINAIFPSTTVDIQMLGRNPAPGTEGNRPQHTVYEMRTGDFWTSHQQDQESDS